ncbi:MAG: dCTP deaminase [Candidatus Obscuribacterales bacterium]
MLLSNTAIFEALDDGRLIIEPQPRPRFKTLIEPKSPYDSTAINLTLGEIISIPKKIDVSIDFRKPQNVPDTLRTLFEEKRLKDGETHALEPGQFILGKTHEKVTLPMDRHEAWGGKPLLAARVEGKSTFARCGLIIHCTAPTIHCGFTGTITLEITCFGRYPVLLTPGMAICQLLVEQVSQDPKDYQSQFQNQVAPAGPQ